MHIIRRERADDLGGVRQVNLRAFEASPPACSAETPARSGITRRSGQDDPNTCGFRLQPEVWASG